MILLFKILSNINGNCKEFATLAGLRLEFLTYSKNLESLTLTIKNNSLEYNLSVLSSLYFINTGNLPEKYNYKGEN